MAHMIERKADGSYSHAYAGETPWHGLGTKVEANLSAAQMLAAAGIDWEVRKQPMFWKGPNQIQHATTMTALLRSTDDMVLDYVPETWNPLQNAEAFDFFHDFVEKGDMEMHTAGSLKDGQVVWGLAKIKNSFSVFGKDVVDNYILFSNPHKFGAAIDIRTTSIRVVCNNTITMALNGKSNQVAKVSHRRKFDADEVKSTLGIVTEKHRRMKEASEFLASKEYTSDQLREFMTTVFPAGGSGKKEISMNAKKAMGIIDQQPGADIFPGTWYNALQAVTFLTSHDMGHQNDSRLYNQWFGKAQAIGVNALNTAVEMANVS